MPTPTSPPKKETFAADTSKRTPLAWAKALFVLLLGLTVAIWALPCSCSPSWARIPLPCSSRAYPGYAGSPLARYM